MKRIAARASLRHLKPRCRQAPVRLRLAQSYRRQRLPQAWQDRNGTRGGGARRRRQDLRELRSDNPTAKPRGCREGWRKVVIAVGFEFNDMLPEVASSYPNVQFLQVDSCPFDKLKPNIHCSVFREYEAAFLTGAEAALTTKTGKVGAISALDIRALSPLPGSSPRSALGRSPCGHPRCAAEQTFGAGRRFVRPRVNSPSSATSTNIRSVVARLRSSAIAILTPREWNMQRDFGLALEPQTQGRFEQALHNKH